MGLDALRLARVRWRCRRGMLENDLILARFLDAHAATLTESDLGQLDTLLDLADNTLWEVIAGRQPPPDAALEPLVARLRSA